jgi:DNA-binding NtrC family response regulator
MTGSRTIAAGASSNETPAKNHILMVDDDDAFREATAGVLRSAGYVVSLAPDYRLALEILESDKPIGVLLVDIVMPDRVNGLALARMARLRRPDISVIYMSGYDIPGLATEALGPIIRKPADDDRLLGAIADALQGKK